jgi:hypothetical protein
MSERIYACLLRLYPAAFRTKYRDEALQLYRDRLRDEAGLLQRCRLYGELLIDALMALPQAWHNTYTAAGVAPLAANADSIPLFRVLDQPPLRPASILIGSTLSLAALSAFGLVMSLPAPLISSSASKHPSAIESVMERLNHDVSPADAAQMLTASASTSASAGQRQSTTGGPAGNPVNSGHSEAAPADGNAAVVRSEGRLDDSERDRVVQAVARSLRTSYFDHAKADEAAATVLNREKQGEYSPVADGPSLAGQLTADIRKATQDQHLEVVYSRDTIPDGPRSPPPGALALYRAAMQQQNCTFQAVEILPHNIGYLKFNSFPDPGICGTIARAALKKMDQASVIIFDLRDNTGGFPEMVAQMASPLFSRPVPWYNPRATPSSTMLSPDPSSGLADKPVYILTSSRTFSGAEHFTYDLKMLKRATVIGETTGGAAHAAPFHRIDDHFGMGIPESPITNPYGAPDWAVTGVEPDVKVRAEDALAAAEKLAAKLQSRHMTP